MGWGQFLIWITGPIVVRVLSVLGLGVVTYTGFSSVLALAHQMISDSFSGLPADAAALLFFSGAPAAMAIILSALSVRIAMMQLSRIQRLT